MVFMLKHFGRDCVQGHGVLDEVVVVLELSPIDGFEEGF